jgi:hypothetical protein
MPQLGRCWSRSCRRGSRARRYDHFRLGRSNGPRSGCGPRPAISQQASHPGLPRVVAHAFATADRYFSLTLATQPALVTKSPRLQELSFFKSTSCSGCCSPFATQSGVSARTKRPPSGRPLPGITQYAVLLVAVRNIIHRNKSVHCGNKGCLDPRQKSRRRNGIEQRLSLGHRSTTTRRCQRHHNGRWQAARTGRGRTVTASSSSPRRAWVASIAARTGDR